MFFFKNIQEKKITFFLRLLIERNLITIAFDAHIVRRRAEFSARAIYFSLWIS